MWISLGDIIQSATALLGYTVGNGIFLEARKQIGLLLNTNLLMVLY